MLQRVDIQYGQWPRIERMTVSVDTVVGARTPSFAVVIPVHNASATLKETFDCILPQLQQRDCICAVENGSSDDSWQMLQAYSNHPSVRLIQIPDACVAQARNTGVENAMEDYILFCDADDAWSAHKLAIYRSLLSQRQDVDFACDISVNWMGNNFESIGLLGPRFKDRALWLLPTFFSALLVRTSLFGTSATLFKRATLQPCVFSPGLTHTQDFEAWCWWTAHMPNPTVMFIDAPLTDYRFEAGLSKQRNQRMANVYHIVCRYASRLPWSQRYIVRGIATMRLMRQALRNQSLGAGVRIWLKDLPHPSIRA